MEFAKGFSKALRLRLTLVFFLGPETGSLMGVRWGRWTVHTTPSGCAIQ